MSTVVFLGGGRITSAMLAGLRLGLEKTRHRLVVHDRNRGKLRDLKKRYAVAVEPDLNRAVKQADVLIIAVRPSSVRELLQMVGKAIGEANRALLGRKTLVVSLAAGVPLRVLSKQIGLPVQWARAMPSPLCRSGRGLTAVTFPRTLPRADRKRVQDLFASFGQVVEIPEKKFDAFTVTYSCSHGYHALATLARAAQAAGLDRRMALLASAHALADGIIAWREGKHSLESLLQEATTPGGIAAATVAKMDAAGYGRAVRQGVVAGLRRARANAAK
ncbi:MAG TPA: NAD(P)-binding domain-containing protein [Terriglobales bacterium]|nr:NAD(P)-binding domain-containing protein [Terriglobales bacterium]